MIYRHFSAALGHNLDVQGEPIEVYRNRLSERRRSHDQLTETDRRFSFVRLGVFAVGVLMLVLVWRQVLSVWLVLLPVAARPWSRTARGVAAT